ncbi:hypothetical protein K1T71_009119 [Dendrolimus kikuchii]|uniref:Uncharacterized protein n=1 Tax=Dendrolimus kikuchii TaxID=765133 RepID=A0ACC1CTM2_9NEOP|nr:hypothetical protein K1T71_009119 [Dendrolimus kikuchii]
MLKINFGKCCVLTILFLNIVTSTTINESSIVRSTYTNNTRDKRSPNSDNTSPSVIDGSIDAKVFGTDVDLGNQIIGPTGSLIIQDQVSSFAIADISCDKPYTPPKMPNFQAPGRRISEARCFEYIYQLKVKDDLERRNQQCNNNSPPNADDSSRPERQVTIAVVGGQKAAPEEFAHMAAIGWLGVNEPIVFKCGGSLISPNFLLTAAHCRSSRPDTELTDLVPRMARIGGNNIGYKKSGEAFDDLRRRRQTDSAQLDVGIVNIITHEQYDPNMQYFDIALMQLAYSLDFSRKIKPACLWVDLQTSNRIRRAVASGWGVVNPSTGRTSLSLQAGELDIIDVNTCNELIRGKFGRKFNGFAEHQLCAGKLSGSVDVCQGDSGGPLQVKVKLPVSTIGNIHAIVGIISAGPDCGKPDMPGIYTRVASFIDWIEPKVWN